MLFYTYWGNINLAICFCWVARIHVCYCVLHVLGQYQTRIRFCRIARIHVSYRVLHVLGQYQTSDLLLRDRPNSCFLLSFTRIGAISNWRFALTGSPEFMFSIVFYTYWGNVKLAIYFYGIARIHVFYCVLHVLGQGQTSDLLLWDRPNSCVLLRFTRIGAMSN